MNESTVYKSKPQVSIGMLVGALIFLGMILMIANQVFPPNQPSQLNLPTVAGFACFALPASLLELWILYLFVVALTYRLTISSHSILEKHFFKTVEIQIDDLEAVFLQSIQSEHKPTQFLRLRGKNGKRIKVYEKMVTYFPGLYSLVLSLASPEAVKNGEIERVNLRLRRAKSSVILSFIGPVLVLVLFGLLDISSRHDYDTRRDKINAILRSGNQTEGALIETPTSTDNNKRFHVRFNYSVGGKSYLGTGTLFPVDSQNLKVGDPIKVDYLLNDPSISVPHAALNVPYVDTKDAGFWRVIFIISGLSIFSVLSAFKERKEALAESQLPEERTVVTPIVPPLPGRG